MLDGLDRPRENVEEGEIRHQLRVARGVLYKYNTIFTQSFHPPFAISVHEA